MNPFDKSDPLAQRLAAWKPATVVWVRDQMMYEAGVAAGRRQARWQMAAILVPLLIGSGGWVWHERTEQSHLELALIERAAESKPRPARSPIAPVELLAPVGAPEPLSYLALSHSMTATGPDRTNEIPVGLVPRSSTSEANRREILTPFSSRKPHAVAEL